MSKHRPRSPRRSPSRRRAAATCCAPLDALLDPRLFRALGDPTRIALLVRLARCRGPCSVGEAAACCAVDLSVVSRHLALLHDAGVLSARKKGRTVLYSVRYGELCRALRALADSIEACCPNGAARRRSKGECHE
ncbi:MAG: winged helix-turn-helix transcriptional regulator [Phycisphaerae bacterium]|nr:metalloregulator ArsR/SmtB family transcription factor [Phycisphaerae bacterium]NUQ45758.1 winged helix-turn-helix transcriptional regulator [Phycisphaerae bacterium]